MIEQFEPLNLTDYFGMNLNLRTTHEFNFTSDNSFNTNRFQHRSIELHNPFRTLLNYNFNRNNRLTISDTQRYRALYPYNLSLNNYRHPFYECQLERNLRILPNCLIEKFIVTSEEYQNGTAEQREKMSRVVNNILRNTGEPSWWGEENNAPCGDRFSSTRSSYNLVRYQKDVQLEIDDILYRLRYKYDTKWPTRYITSDLYKEKLAHDEEERKQLILRQNLIEESRLPEEYLLDKEKKLELARRNDKTKPNLIEFLKTLSKEREKFLLNNCQDPYRRLTVLNDGALFSYISEITTLIEFRENMKSYVLAESPQRFVEGYLKNYYKALRGSGSSENSVGQHLLARVFSYETTGTITAVSPEPNDFKYFGYKVDIGRDVFYVDDANRRYQKVLRSVLAPSDSDGSLRLTSMSLNTIKALYIKFIDSTDSLLNICGGSEEEVSKFIKRRDQYAIDINKSSIFENSDLDHITRDPGNYKYLTYGALDELGEGYKKRLEVIANNIAQETLNDLYDITTHLAITAITHPEEGESFRHWFEFKYYPAQMLTPGCHNNNPLLTKEMMLAERGGGSMVQIAKSIYNHIFEYGFMLNAGDNLKQEEFTPEEENNIDVVLRQHFRPTVQGGYDLVWMPAREMMKVYELGPLMNDLWFNSDDFKLVCNKKINEFETTQYYQEWSTIYCSDMKGYDFALQADGCWVRPDGQNWVNFRSSQDDFGNPYLAKFLEDYQDYTTANRIYESREKLFEELEIKHGREAAINFFKQKRLEGLEEKKEQQRNEFLQRVMFRRIMKNELYTTE